MGLAWITFQGKQILSCNYQEVKTPKDQVTILEKQWSMIEQAPQPVLLLVDMQGMMMTPEGSQFTKEHLLTNNTKIKKIAVVGATQLKKVVVEGIRRSISGPEQELFDTIDEAKAWLVS